VDIPVRASFWRGGTSRAVLFNEADLAAYDDRALDAVILAALGSPDPLGRQIDGLGGGISSLSKAAIIGRAPDGSGADITFRFAQVDVQAPCVEFSGNCGNIAAAVGPFAVEEGLVQARDPETRVTVLSVNTGQRFVAHVPVREGHFDPDGDFAIPGVQGTGARIGLEYLEPGGSIGRGPLPTSALREQVRLADGREVNVSIVDVANPMVYVRAADLGATGTEAPAAIDADGRLVSELEALRDEAAVRIGLARTVQEAREHSRAIPKVAMVGPPVRYLASDGAMVEAEDVDLVVRMLSMGRTHRTLAMTAAICTAAAAAMTGTVVHDVTWPGALGLRQVRLGHAAGTLPIEVDVWRRDDGNWHVSSATTYRTSRRIMAGSVFVPESYLRGEAWFQSGGLPGAKKPARELAGLA
jgi:2-methylaconitate cis-trans-isomerase PrpF